MSYFYPIGNGDSKADANVASSSNEFLTLDESNAPFFRSYDNGVNASPAVDAASAAFFEASSAPVVFRSVGSSLSIPSFGAPLTRSTQPDSGAEEDDSADAGAGSHAAEWGVQPPNAGSTSAVIRSALKSLSLSSVVADAIEVEEAPAFIERHSSFLSHTAPTDILLALASVLETQSIEFQYTPNKHKIRGVVLAESVSATFVIRVWRRSSESAYLVEFQRRSGCVVTFTNFYRACAQSLSHLMVGGSTTINASGRTTSPVPFELTLNSSQPKLGAVTLDAPTLTALTEMAGSADTVCASEAMRVLSRAVATSPANQQFVLASTQSSNSAVAALKATISSPNAYLQLLACKLAVALVTVVAVTAPLHAAITKLLPAASITAVATSDLIARETLRVLRSVSAVPALASAKRSDKLALPATSDKLSLAIGAGFTPVAIDSASDAHSFNELF